MKNKSFIAMFTCMLISQPLQAKKPDCNEFLITIQNNTSYDCVLKTSKILTGDLFESANIPKVIFRGHTDAFLMSRAMLSPRYHGLHGASIYLRYQCGENEEVSLLSYLPGYLVSSYFSPPKIIGSILDSQHIKVTSTQIDPKECSILSAIPPANLAWTFNDEAD